MRLQPQRVNISEECFYSLVSHFNAFNIQQLRLDLLKEGSTMSALWIIFLRYRRKLFSDKNNFRYASIEAFLAEYEGHFEGVDATEQQKLMDTANWMHLLFKTVPAKRNKGFFLHVVPKFLEGFEVKYTLGTGQSKLTNFRADIFEHESGVKAAKRKHLFTHVKHQPSALEISAVGSLFADPAVGMEPPPKPPRSSPLTEAQEAERKRLAAAEVMVEMLPKVDAEAPAKRPRVDAARLPRDKDFSFSLIERMGDKDYVPSFELNTPFELAL